MFKTEMIPELKLSNRLAAAAEMCGEGSVADIGTDHALLPIKLVLDGHPCAAACDIREGPCERARRNIEKFGLGDKIKVFCRPGLDRIEDFAPDNIFICGMGGEMIASILGASDYPKNSRCRLILQPQSMQDVLRRYLCSNGFSINRESVVHDSGKYYQLILAEYDGIGRELNGTEQRLGHLNIERARRELSPVDKGWLNFVLSAAKRRIDGRKNAISSADDPVDTAMTDEIEKILGGRKNADN